MNKNRLPGLLALLTFCFSLFTFKTIAQPAFAWAHIVPQGNWPDIAHGQNGNVYMVGNFGGTMDADLGIGVTNITGIGNEDIYVTKYAPNGSLIWAKVIGSFTGTDIASRVTVDAEDNVYVAGYFHSTVDFDPGPGVHNVVGDPSPGRDHYLLKLNSNGDFKWVKHIKRSGGGNRALMEIATDNNKNVYVCGYFYGGVDFDGGGNNDVLLANGYVNSYLLKYDSTGAFEWVKHFDTDDSVVARKLLVDNDKLIVSGYFHGTVDFDANAGTTNLAADPVGAGFLSKYDLDGDLVWAKKLCNQLPENDPMDIQIDNWGNIYTAGSFRVPSDFDPGPGTTTLTTTDVDAYLEKFNTNGEIVWVKQMSGSNVEVLGLSRQTYANGDLLLYGTYSGGSDIDLGAGTTTIPAVAGMDIVLSKIDTAGNMQWYQILGGEGYEHVSRVELAQNGSIYAVGYFQDTMDFNPGAGIAMLEGNPIGPSSPSNYLFRLGDTLQTASVRDISFANISVYPNPAASGTFSVSSSKKITELRVTDITGKVVYTQTPNDDKARVKISAAPGIYNLYVVCGDEVTVKKISLQE